MTPPDPKPPPKPGPGLWGSSAVAVGSGSDRRPESSRRGAVQALAVVSRAGDGLPAREPPVRSGDCVSHYEIIEEIGRGGMGVVFQARDTVLDRDVALKCPWPFLARDPVVRQRFMHEAHAAGRLAHPHIVPVFEVLEWDGIPWLAMELIEGRSLRSLLSERGALPLDVILRCSEGLADALHAAHAKRILHRDLNPNNVLLTAEAWPFLTDFGLARVFLPRGFDSGDSTLSQALTGDGHIVGTRCYMSPEQILGQTLDARTDIFSFGAVLYEMCTGLRAFPTSEPGSENDAILHHEPSAIRAINREIPEDLERITRKALAKRPDERYQAASDLLADLVGVRRRVESGQHIPGPRPRHGRKATWAVAPILLAAVAALLLWKVPSLRGPSRAFPAATPRRIATDVGSESEPAVSPDGSLIAYVSNATGTPNTWVVDVRGGNPLRLTDDPYGGRSPAWFPDGSALALVSDRAGGQAVWKVPRLGGAAVLLVPDAEDPAPSPDGARIAFTRRAASGYRRIFVAPLVDPSHAVPLTGDGDGHGDHAEPAWSPDGRTICYADDRNLWLVDVEAGHPRRLTNESTVDHQPVWSRGGRSVIFTSGRDDTQALWRVAANGGAPERLTLGAGPETGASLSRDGSRLVYSTHAHKHGIALVDLATGRRQLIPGPLDDTAPTLAPDASALVFRSTRQGGRYQVWLQPLSRGSPVGQPRLLTDLPGFVSTPALSPDSRWVAFRREYEAGRSEIWIVSVSGGLAERLSDGAGVEWQPAWSPDGSALAWASERGGRCHIWVTPIRDGRPTGPPRQITAGETSDSLPAWSPDGKEIAYAGDNETEVWVVPVAGDQRPRRVSRGKDTVGRLRWQAQTGWLWFARAGSKTGPQLWKVSPRGGEPVEAVRPDWLQGAAPPGEFDLSADGHLLALTLEREARGDIWLLEAERGAY